MASPKIDWENEYDAWILVHKPKGMKQYEFAELKGVTDTWLSTRFNEIENERLMMTNKTKMPKLLAKALDNVETALDEAPDRSIAELRVGISVTDKAKLSLEAVKTMSDRLGLSPAAMTINMQQNNSKNIAILAMPIFAAEAQPLMDKFLGKVIDADTTPDS